MKRYMLTISLSTGERHLYADDTKTFVIGDTTDNVIQLLNVLPPLTMISSGVSLPKVLSSKI